MKRQRIIPAMIFHHGEAFRPALQPKAATWLSSKIDDDKIFALV